MVGFQIHAISEFLKNPLPTVENNENIIDLSPILDFCSHLELVQICGNSSPYKQSNIVLNKIPFELDPFKVCTMRLTI